MAADAVAAVEGRGVAAVELPHSAGERRRARLHHEVVAVRQQAEGQAAPVEAAAAFAEDLEEERGILRQPEHRLAAVAEGGEVVDRAGPFEAKWPCHAASLAAAGTKTKT